VRGLFYIYPLKATSGNLTSGEFVNRPKTGMNTPTRASKFKANKEQ